MKFQITSKKRTEQHDDCLVVHVGIGKDGGLQLFSNANKLDTAITSFLLKVATTQEFEGKLGSTLLFHDASGNHVLAVGIGDEKKLTMKDWLGAMATVSREVTKIRQKTVSIIAEKEIMNILGAQKTAEGIVVGMMLGAYTFNRYKKMEKEEHGVEIVNLVSLTEVHSLEKGIEQGEMIAQGVVLARDLVNEPASVTTPTFLSLIALDIAKKSPLITAEIYEKKDMERFGMGGILGIAKGSDENPKLIKLSYQGGGSKTIAIVGKGVTFDSGGLSLKTSDGMENMKIDMAGAASVLGILSVVSNLKLNINVIGVIPAVENMPSGGAIRPGDVVKAHNGKTIEIISTDAEGRVILADALSWITQTEKLDAVIDLATLTGACMVALGEDIAGLFSNAKALSVSLLDSSRSTGEPLWELPLFEGYKELIESDIADIRNMSKKRYGGAITAALFLQAFVPETVSFAHIDIAGPAIAEKSSALTPVGGTGFGVRLLVEYLQRLTVREERKTR